jgi:hypothetical protein
MMKRESTFAIASLAALMALLPGSAPLAAQATPLDAGVMAPDFTLPGATRHGVLAEPISLRDYAGKTVVLAFFFRARTRG